MKAVLKYPGAKNRIAGWICSYIPKHEVYLEPYAGSLAVLFHKEPCHIETVNDLNDEVVHFFHILRDQPEELQRAVALTPYSRTEYEKAYQVSEDGVERARRFCIRCWMGFGNSDLYKNGFKNGQQAKSPNPAGAWAGLPEVMGQAAVRLKTVQIENLPAAEVIRRYHTSDVFIYADPPYLHGTRKNYLYRHEMTEQDHEELLELLLIHPGKVMVSGYENELYNERLKGWRKIQTDTCAEGGAKRKETIWMNYRDTQMSLYDYPGVVP